MSAESIANIVVASLLLTQGGLLHWEVHKIRKVRASSTVRKGIADVLQVLEAFLQNATAPNNQPPTT
jgi:hypothetical protein